MDTKYNFNVILKRIQQEGTLAWEYNPLRNYRLDETMIFYKNRFWTIPEFKDKFIKDPNVTYDEQKGFLKNDTEINDWNDLINLPKTEEIPVVYQKGQLVDFITDELNFDLNHPVQITPQYSYDNSVDLIINDGISLPKIINSRFSAIGRNKYEIVDRNGNNDTNIYDRGEQFQIDTSLYKITTKIPEITFGGESYGGNLPIGNYHFYFKYSDLDGNETDFIGQSGLVSVFMGNTPDSIYSGFRDQNSHKRVRFLIKDIDASYDYIIVYYSKASGAEFENRTTKYVRINQKYKVSQSNLTVVDITGFEPITEVSDIEINQRLQVYESAKTQAVAQNMLFLGNVTKNNEEHDLLSKLALYIIPQLDCSKTCNVDLLSSTYNGSIKNTYYDPNFIYNSVGYWEDELYRFGVVFIRANSTLTPVYNIRGMHLGNNLDLKDDTVKEGLKYDPDKVISYDETSFLIDSDFVISNTEIELENAKGVCYIPKTKDFKLTSILGIQFICDKTVIEALKSKHIKGFFIVRQKRIPTTLCQAYTIGLESESHLPMLPTVPTGDSKNPIYKYEGFLNKTAENYAYFNDGKWENKKGWLLSHNFQSHLQDAPDGTVQPKAAICPDYDVNQAYLNTLFSGETFTVIPQYSQQYLTSNGRMFNVPNNITLNQDTKDYEVKIIGVEDNVKLVGIGDDLFSARGGEAEEAYRFAHVGNKDTTEKGGSNLIRGSFGNYLGISGYDYAGDLITIKIPGYNRANMSDYFTIRYNDASMFYPISDRISWNKVSDKDDLVNLGTFYRGDCYICKFTHRLNRNFQDASTPTNDDIVDSATWTKNIKYEGGVLKTEDLDKINLGDINAVNLGMWVTFILRSNINHSIRSLDESQVDEAALVGHCRGFYPYHPASPVSGYKLPESNTYNKGFEATVGEQVFEELPIVPYFKERYPTRIAYSNLQITSAFRNAFRVFKSTNYRDYPITYGEITKIIEWNGDLICVLEHGIYRIPINERALAGEGSGGTVYINTSNVLPENPDVISDTFGSQWSDSIIKTPIGIYGVDTVGKKIWKVDNNGIELISDFKVQEFLNNNITFTERELTPIIGIRNVKTHYNSFKKDVMFTFYDDLNGFNECVWNLCWNESMNKWVTFYSWVPSFSENIYNQYFSFDRETSKQIAKLALNDKSEQFDHIYLDHTQMTNKDNAIGRLHYDSPLYEGDDVECQVKWEIMYDVHGNYKKFEIEEITNESEEKNSFWLKYKGDYNDYLCNLPEEITYQGIKYTQTEKEWFPKEPNKLDKYDGDSIENTFEYDHFSNKWIISGKEFPYITKDDISYKYNTEQEVIRFQPNEQTDNIKIKSQPITAVSDITLINILNKRQIQEWKKKLDLNQEKNDQPNFPSMSKDIFRPQKVYTLNIRVTPTIIYKGSIATRAEYIANKNANSQLTGGYIDRTICVIPEDHLKALSTDFWKHGQSGIIDIKEDIKPTKWYGKQHPFEFEFIVRDAPDTHKIFDNLIIISNKAEPESFHYEIIGECYEFANDKKNMYIRQEATKEFFQSCGNNIEFNSNYKDLESIHRPLYLYNDSKLYQKSTIFPSYYLRQNTLNTVEDYYHSRSKDGYNFNDLCGAEIIYYKNLDEFRIWNHSRGVNTQYEGPLRGNMRYIEDKWKIQVSPINLVQYNEPEWAEGCLPNFGNPNNQNIPIELQQANFFKKENIEVPQDNVSPLDKRGITLWPNKSIRHSEVKLKDKYIKIRIRYSGEDLAVISAIKTLYSISYA